MALKYKLQKLEGIEPAIAGLYVEKEEAGAKVYVLDVEGVADEAKLKEFRTNNMNLHKQVTDLQQRYDGIDPEEVKTLKEAIGGLKAEELPEIVKKAKDLEKIVENRTQAMRVDHEKAIGGVKADNERLKRQLSELAINQTTVAEGSKLGLRSTAHLDLTYRARQVFVLDAKGNPVAYEADGKTLKYGKESNPLTIKEWIETQVTEAPHLFEDSKGTGGNGGDGKGSGGGDESKNPFAKGTPDFNLTAQSKLVRENPALARRLAAKVGVILPGA